MKDEKLLDAIGMVGDDLVKAAKAPNKKLKKKILYSAVAAVLTVTLVVGAVHLVKNPPLELYAKTISEAEYPDKTKVSYYDSIDSYDDKEIDKSEFFMKTIDVFLGDTDDENMVFSPLSAYMALGMLAECTGGESRQQILDLLGNESIESLRDEASLIWNVHYINNNITTNILASSMWLDESVEFNKDTMKNISDTYYASSYHVDMTSKKYEKALKTWLKEQTGNMLNAQIDNMNLDPNSVLALLNTIYFKTMWSDEFLVENTKEEVFHSVDGDENCQMMNQKDMMGYYWGDNFSAVEKYFKGSGSMYFILPDEGVTTKELFEHEEAMAFMASTKSENRKTMNVTLSLPKFDVESKLNLIDGLKELGVTDVFEFQKSDFEPMIESDIDVAVASVTQGTRVVIDEEGCEAATYTEIQGVTLSASPEAEEIDFTIDRPFIFMVVSDVGIPMFVGVVNHIN